MLVHDFLQQSAERTPDKLALICDGQRLTYAEVEAQANRLAHGLLAAGVTRGDRVAVWLPNSVEAVAAIFAILKAGATFLVINATTKQDKLAYILNNCAASALFGPAREHLMAQHLFATVPSLRCTVLCGKGAAEPSTDHRLPAYSGILGANPPSRPSCHTVDVDLACLIYT